MRVLIIGCTGMLGTSIMLQDTAHELRGTYVGLIPKAKNILELDITKINSVRAIIEKEKPDAIINTAAITNVDACEEHPDLAYKLHVEGTMNLAISAKEHRIYLLQISTDSVFDGIKGNYDESDSVNPLSVYSKTKYQSELKALEYENACVVRTNIYGLNWLPKESIAEWILNSLRGKKQITMLKDVFFTPILTNHLGEILMKMVESNLQGLYHVAGSECISKLDFSYKIASLYQLDTRFIKPISINELKLKAVRPLNPSLKCEKIQKDLKIQVPNVDQGLIYFKKLESGAYFKKVKDF